MTEDKLPANWTKEKLAALTAKKRFALLESVKATKIGTQQDRERLIEAIIESGSIFGQTAMKSDNPMLYRIHEIVNSKAGREACIAATESGLPALAGIEPEIVRQLGDQYRSTFMATNEAGAIVGRLMRDLNIYERVGQRPMPEGSVANSATVWKLKR